MPDLKGIFVDDILGFNSEPGNVDPILVDVAINNQVIKSQLHTGNVIYVLSTLYHGSL